MISSIKLQTFLYGTITLSCCKKILGSSMFMQLKYIRKQRHLLSFLFLCKPSNDPSNNDYVRYKQRKGLRPVHQNVSRDDNTGDDNNDWCSENCSLACAWLVQIRTGLLVLLLIRRFLAINKTSGPIMNKEGKWRNLINNGLGVFDHFQLLIDKLKEYLMRIIIPCTEYYFNLDEVSCNIYVKMALHFMLECF